MGITKINLAVEPFESGKVVFLPMTPRNNTGKARGRVMLRLSITNNENVNIKFQSVTVSFPGYSMSKELPISQMVNSHKKLIWWFQNPFNNILFDLPGPDQIQFKFWVTGYTEQKIYFSERIIFTYNLAPHISPVSGGAYLFPAKAADLGFGEFWHICGCIHATGKQGSQSFGYDMGVWGVDPQTGLFSENIPGTHGGANIHKRIFGKPLYAMADGIVLHSLNVCPNNLWPLKWENEDELKAKSEEQRINNWAEFDNSTDLGGAGNHFYIKHNDEVILYAHMQKGSLTESLLPTGTQVKAGERLGLAGNSGASSGPHTHIHAIQGEKPEVGSLRPIILKDCWMIDNNLITDPVQKGTWAKTNKTGISEGSSLAWDQDDVFLFPSGSLPEYPEIVKHHVAENSYPAMVEEFFGKGFRPVWLQGYAFGGLTFFNVIFRPASGLLWQARSGLDKNEYEDEYNLWVTGNGYRIANVCTYWSHVKNKIVYAVLFEKVNGPIQMPFHGKTYAEHMQIFDDLTAPAKGFVPTQISVVSVLGTRWYTGVYEKKTIAGGWELKTRLSADEFQQKWDEHSEFNRGLVWLHTYVHNGQANFVGLWFGGSIPKGNHDLTSETFESELIIARNRGLYLRGLNGYVRNSVPTYAAFWNR